MSVSLPIARVSLQMSGSLMLNNLENNQAALLKVQQQLSSGQALNQASDNPTAAMGIVSLKRQISQNSNYSSNLTFVSGFLSQADSTLGSVTNLINQAQSIASSQVGADASPDQRAAEAQVVSSLLSEAQNLANTQYQGQSVFGGQNGTAAAFTAVGGGYKYQGTTTPQGILTPTGQTINYTLSGDTAFGAVSSQVIGYQNLTPALTASTRLADLGGATSKGIAAGPVNITVGGTTTTVDFSQAATAGDVVNMLNAGLAAAGTTATVTLGGGGFTINGDSTNAVTISDALKGTTAADLGIATTVPALSSQTGNALSPQITATTTLASLRNGAGIDPSGITISNGANSATITLAGPPPLNTVEDLLNAINGSGTNVEAQINAAGTGINLLNPLSGTAMSVGENGGSTADELGIRSFNTQSNLSDFNNGTGVTPIGQTIPGPTGQIMVTRTDGTQFAVQVNGIKTPAQLIAAINSAAGNSTVTAALNSTGNGITLTDTTGGSGNLTVSAGSDYVSNGTNLGILSSGTGGTLTGGNIAFSTDDLQITRRDGSSFTVSLDGATTVQDVLNRINTADGNTTPATQVTASLNPTGNGIQLSDASTGSGALTVTAINSSPVAGQLGLDKTAASATPGVINGDDTNQLQPQGLFSSLSMLQEALASNDTAGINRAAALLQNDSQRVIEANGVVGAQEQDVSNRQTQSSADDTSLKSALSLLNDTDFTAAATTFQQLQTAYQASLEVSQQTSNMSLLDFLK